MYKFLTYLLLLHKINHSIFFTVIMQYQQKVSKLNGRATCTDFTFLDYLHCKIERGKTVQHKGESYQTEEHILFR